MIKKYIYEFETNEKSDELFDEIVDELISRFNMPSTEALARVNAQWHGQKFIDDDDIGGCKEFCVD